MKTIRLQAGDGTELDADLIVAEQAWAGAVVAHPHPAYGGNRHNPVVDALFRSLAAAGVTVLRFDFRSDDTGPQDLGAAVDEILSHLEPQLPLWLLGYSFGADIALGLDHPRVAGWAGVAPPLKFGPTPWPPAADHRPALLVAAEHDQINPPADLGATTTAWVNTTTTVVPGVDHFLAGVSTQVADTVVAWLRASADDLRSSS